MANPDLELRRLEDVLRLARDRLAGIMRQVSDAAETTLIQLLRKTINNCRRSSGTMENNGCLDSKLINPCSAYSTLGDSRCC
jgi:hypothetical protein